jgi:hypothetical protein
MEGAAPANDAPWCHMVWHLQQMRLLNGSKAWNAIPVLTRPCSPVVVAELLHDVTADTNVPPGLTEEEFQAKKTEILCRI